MAKIKISSLSIANYLLIGILLCSVFFRFYRIGELHTFHNDEGRDVLIAQEMIQTGKPTFLGPQTSVGNMYLGPLYYYLMVPALILSGGDPVGPAIMIAFSGVISTYLIYLLSKKWFGLNSALTSSLIFAVSPLFVHYTSSSWNPNLVPLVSILIIMAWQANAHLALGLLFGVLLQLHYVAMAFAVVIFLWHFVETKNIRIIPKIILGFILTTLPFWFFEVRHDFLNLQSLFTYIEGSGVKNGNVAPYLERLINNSESIINNIILSRTLTNNTTPYYLFITTLVFSFLSLPWFMSESKKKHSFRLWYILIATLLITSVLKETLYPHYLGYLFPIIALLIGSVLGAQNRYIRVAGFSYLFIWLIYSMPVTLRALGGEGSMQKLKGIEVAGYIIRDSAGKPYNVVGSVSNSRETTYIYYLRKLSSPPSSSPEELLYVICEDAPCSEQDLTNPLLFARGAAHPYLDKTLTHPYTPIFNRPVNIVKTTHVVYGVWVSRVIVGDKQLIYE